MTEDSCFTIQKGNIFAVPTVHYNMEMAAQARLAFLDINPDCVAVELAETMQLQMLHAASRLPDISIVIGHDKTDHPIYYMCEPCDAAFEGLRSALEANVPAFCIDLDVDYYPDVRENIPDPYAIQRIGLKQYYESYLLGTRNIVINEIDHKRELHMARRLKELSLTYDRILFIGGMAHIKRVLELIDRNNFPEIKHAERDRIELCTITPESCREILAEYGWMSSNYEQIREDSAYLPDRHKLIYRLFKESGEKYKEITGNAFPGYHMRNLMKFSRNYALIHGQLMPDLYQILNSSKGCVDHNYAYETWELATQYPYLRNIDGLPEVNLTVAELWKHSKFIRFHLKQPGRKNSGFQRRKRDKSRFTFKPPHMLFSICSYPPEDKVVEGFGDFLRKKGVQVLTEDASHIVPFSTSIEDGIDVKETVRHWFEKKLYVRMKGKPPGGVGSVVVIFDEDQLDEKKQSEEKYPWLTTWIGEHQQESDMAFYATPLAKNVVGPGISRCEYGGFLMSYPPRRLENIWVDVDYEECKTKAETLLMAAIDYAIQPIIVYVASKPPRSFMKNFAQRFGKKIVYIPIGQLSPITLNKIRAFHVLDGHDRRTNADEYIY